MSRHVEDFESWVRARSGALARAAYLLTGDVQLAEDLVQETLARVADHWRRISRSGGPDAYARRVMHNLSIDRWRRRSVRPRELLTADHPEPSRGHGLAEHRGHPELRAHGDDAEAVAGRLVLREALARLTPKQRAVLSLRFYEDLTEVQTAEVLGCSSNTVKSQTRAALERLRVLAPDLLATFDRERPDQQEAAR